MSGGTFARCLGCGRIVIYGQVCTCGNATNGQQKPASAGLSAVQTSGVDTGADEGAGL